MRSVEKPACIWVKATNFLILVTEAYTDWLAQEEHVGDIVPAPWVDNGCKVLSNTARAEFLEETNQTVTTGSTVQPESDRVVGGILTTFKEPKEAVDIGCKVNVAGVGIDTFLVLSALER